MDKMNFIRKISVTVFLIFPLLLLAIIFCSADRSISANENRTLKTKSDVKWSVTNGAFQNWLEDYLSDQFPLRDSLKQAEIECRLAFGAQELGGAYIGEGGRLFQKVTQANVNEAACLRYARRVNRLAAETELPTYVMYVPSAGVALQQQLPKGAPMYDGDALFAELIKELPDTQVIDLRRRMASDAGNYYATDHHWTAQGAQSAYQAWCQVHEIAPQEAELVSVSDTFQGTLYSKVPSRRVPMDTIRAIKLDPLPDLLADGQEIPFYDAAALATKDQYNFFQGGNHGIAVVTNSAIDEGEGKTLLLLKDSFANSLVPFLIGHYRQIIMIDERYAFVDAGELAQAYGVDEIAVVRELISTP